MSASLEDYLEAIFNLSGESSEARSKDIAKLLGVAKSSVTGALRVLKEKELANYKPYGSVTLTMAGRKAAAEIVRKHNVLKSFFVDVLGIEAETAQRAACKAEHTMGSEIITKLLSSIELVTKSNGKGGDWAAEFSKFYRKNKKKEKMEISTMEEKNPKPLSTVKAGETVTLVSIRAGRSLNSRLASMGLVSNVKMTVVSDRHSGPVVISVKGSRMMLGRGIAHKIMVI